MIELAVAAPVHLSVALAARCSAEQLARRSRSRPRPLSREPFIGNCAAALVNRRVRTEVSAPRLRTAKPFLGASGASSNALEVLDRIGRKQASRDLVSTFVTSVARTGGDGRARGERATPWTGVPDANWHYVRASRAPSGPEPRVGGAPSWQVGEPGVGTSCVLCPRISCLTPSALTI